MYKFQVTGITSNAVGYAIGYSTSNPSVFSYNPSATSNPLIPIIDGNYAWATGQGLYVFIRGNGLEGSGNVYIGGIISPVTIADTGTINQGNVDVAIVNGGINTNNYNLIGNPYPSPINLKNSIA